MFILSAFYYRSPHPCPKTACVQRIPGSGFFLRVSPPPSLQQKYQTVLKRPCAFLDPVVYALGGPRVPTICAPMCRAAAARPLTHTGFLRRGGDDAQEVLVCLLHLLRGQVLQREMYHRRQGALRSLIASWFMGSASEAPTWYWVGEFHSPISWLIHKLKK